jgi:hypothetical protein
VRDNASLAVVLQIKAGAVTIGESASFTAEHAMAFLANLVLGTGGLAVSTVLLGRERIEATALLDASGIGRRARDIAVAGDVGGGATASPVDAAVACANVVAHAAMVFRRLQVDALRPTELNVGDRSGVTIGNTNGANANALIAQLSAATRNVAVTAMLHGCHWVKTGAFTRYFRVTT